MRRIAGVFLSAAVAALVVIAPVASGQESTKAQAELATALSAKHVSLATGITDAGVKGTPISAKYEYEDGKLQLSVYTQKAGQFYEVIIDHHSGKVAETKKISDGEDLTKAKAQSEAMAKAKKSLKMAVAKALTDNPGYSAVSATPALSGGQASAEVTLMKGRAFKTVTEPLA